MTGSDVLAVSKELREKWEAEYYKWRPEPPNPLVGCFHCRRSWCCQMMILCHPQDGVLIAEHLIQTDQRDLVEEAFLMAKRQVKVCGNMPKNANSHAKRTRVWEKQSKKWERKQVDCAFLKNDRCAIYEVRPSVCAAYYIQGNPSECAPTPAGKPGVAGLIYNFRKIRDMQNRQTMEFVERLGGPAGTVIPPRKLGLAVRDGVKMLTGDLSPLRLAKPYHQVYS